MSIFLKRIRKWQLIVVMFANIIAVNFSLLGQIDDCSNNPVFHSYHHSFEGDVKPIQGYLLKVNLGLFDSTCDLYSFLYKNYATNESSSQKQLLCKLDEPCYSLDDLKYFVGSDVEVSYQYRFSAIVGKTTYQILVVKMTSIHRGDCIQSFIMVRQEDGFDILPRLRSAKEMNALKELLCYYDLSQFANPNVLHIGKTRTQYGDEALSPIKIYKRELVPKFRQIECIDTTVSTSDFCIATSISGDEQRVVRNLFHYDTIKFKAPRGPEGDITGTDDPMCKLLTRFMIGTEALTLGPLYQNPDHAPRLTYTQISRVASDRLYERNYLQKKFFTEIPNRYSLPLIGVQLDAYADDKFVKHLAILLIKTEAGYKIFTDLDKYPDLVREATFRLSFKSLVVDHIAYKPYAKMSSDVERTLWKSSRRPGEERFLVDYLIDFIEENSEVYRDHVYKSVTILGPNEFWF